MDPDPDPLLQAKIDLMKLYGARLTEACATDVDANHKHGVTQLFQGVLPFFESETPICAEAATELVQGFDRLAKTYIQALKQLDSHRQKSGESEHPDGGAGLKNGEPVQQNGEQQTDGPVVKTPQVHSPAFPEATSMPVSNSPTEVNPPTKSARKWDWSVCKRVPSPPASEPTAETTDNAGHVPEMEITVEDSQTNQIIHYVTKNTPLRFKGAS